MSIPSESRLEHHHDDDSGTYDMGFGESDMESVSSTSDVDEPVPKYYWLGKKYFDCVMAESLCRGTRLYETAASIDVRSDRRPKTVFTPANLHAQSKLERRIRLFPYQRCLTAFKSQGVATLDMHLGEDVPDPYHIIIASVGSVFCKGSRDEKSRVVALLRLQMIDPSASELGNERLNSTTNGRDSSTSDLGKYSSALQEHGTRHGFAPRYEVEALSAIPPKFQATVSFQGRNFEGVARKKKQAKQMAAREACSALGVQA